MIEFVLAASLTCTDADSLISKIQKSQVIEKSDLIEVIKTNTEPECYEGSESST